MMFGIVSRAKALRSSTTLGAVSGSFSMASAGAWLLRAVTPLERVKLEKELRTSSSPPTQPTVPQLAGGAAGHPFLTSLSLKKEIRETFALVSNAGADANELQ
jgi:hypothetical protein